MKNKQPVDFYKLLYYSTFVICMINFLRPYSLWGVYDLIGPYINLLSIGLSLVSFVFIIPRYEGHNALLMIFILLFILIVGINSDKFLFLWTSFVLIVGAKDISFHSIVKVHFVVSLSFCLLNVFGYELGLLKQANNYLGDLREGFGGDLVERLHFGYGWATDFANHVFFILLDYWILHNGKLSIMGYLLFLFVPPFIIIYTDTRLATGCIILLMLSSIYLSRKEKKIKQISSITKKVLIFSLPFFAVTSIWATIDYEPTNLYWFAANIVLSNRLQYGADAINEFGISWLGQPVEMHGAIDAGGMAEYNFVDCSYVQFLIRYGVVFISLIVFLFIRMSLSAVSRDDRVLLFAIMIAGVSGIIAQFVFDYRYCVLFLALMASHRQIKDGQIMCQS